MNRQESAETLALQALTWLSSQPEEFGAFLNASGASISDLPALAASSGFLGAVLDFMLESDKRVIAFCDAGSLPYTAPMHARVALPGGQNVNWT